MKKFRLTIAAVLSALPVALSAAQLADFNEFTVSPEGHYVDKTGQVSIKPGRSGLKVVEGPLPGTKAFAFDGTLQTVANLDLKNVRAKLDGFETTVSFWVYFDEFQPKGENLAGNDTGFGLALTSDSAFNFRMNTVSPMSIGTTGTVTTGRWNHVAFLYSLEKRNTQLFVNGYPVLNVGAQGKRFPLRQGYSSIGKFKGKISGLEIHNTMIDPQTFLNMEMTEPLYKALSGRLDKILQDAPAAKVMYDSLRSELDKSYAAKKITMIDFDAFSKRLSMTERLVPAVNAMAKTDLKNSPVALMQVRAISPIIRLPEAYPPDPVYTDTLKVRTAKDAYESISFIVHPYKNIEKFELELSDLKHESGTVLPAADQELKLVKCWFQPPWNSYFNGHGHYVPSLLLNDEELIRVDERTKINYLRLNYPDGIKYVDICEPGSVLKHPPFVYAFEPAYDADTLQPVKLRHGRGNQFWLTLHAPKGTPAGIYRGTLKMKADGVDAGTAKIEMNVLPFDLPLPRTQHNLEEEYHTHLHGSDFFGQLVNELKDIDKARERALIHTKNQLKHGIRDMSAGYMISGPGLSGKNEYFKETVKMMQDLGITTRNMHMGAADRGGLTLEAHSAKVSLEDLCTPERLEKETAIFKKDVDLALKALDDNDIPYQRGYFYGMDEATSASSMRFMSYFRDYIFRKGGRVESSGWHNNFRNMPSHEMYHHQAAVVSRDLSSRWHAIGGYLFCYCGPFIGPDNPDLMRRSHGMKMYRANYDGWMELAYNASRYHTWNHRFGYDTTYRPFRFTIDTPRGPAINALAINGMREGTDDVRYATLINLLARECFESGKIENAVAARKAIAWFRNLPYPFPQDLYAMRDEMIPHILGMMKLLGKEIK